MRDRYKKQTKQSTGIFMLRIRYLLKTIISGGLILLLISWIDIAQILNALSTSELHLVLISFLVTASQGIFEGARLRIAFSKYQISYLEGVRMFLIGIFFANFMPGLIGSDVYQVSHLHSKKRGLLTPISLSLFLRINGLAINLILLVISISIGGATLINNFEADLNQLSIPIASQTILITLICATALFISVFWSKTIRIIGSTLHDLIKKVISVSAACSFKSHCYLVTLGVLIVLSRVISLYVLVVAFGESLTPNESLFALTATTMVMVLPVSLAGLGIREVTLSVLLVTFGVEPHHAVAISLVGRCFIWLLSVVGGCLFVILKQTVPIQISN